MKMVPVCEHNVLQRTVFFSRRSPLIRNRVRPQYALISCSCKRDSEPLLTKSPRVTQLDLAPISKNHSEDSARSPEAENPGRQFVTGSDV